MNALLPFSSNQSDMENQKRNLTTGTRLFLLIAASALIAANFVPIWMIELDAPQYPEGLNLKIHSSKLGGNVDIVNGLNHYIGMKTLHSEDFIEFKLIPYILAAYALFSILVAFVGSVKWLKVLLIAFIVFGIVAMVDFWRWEYDYGHNLDPNAAIIVPGMAYQPPLIGFKQLLNFGAYSIPDTGGWMIIGAGVLMLLSVFIEYRTDMKIKKNSTMAVATLALLLLSSCSRQPQEININKDNCSYCEMTISDMRFGAELLTDKGRVYKFDDLSCMFRFKKEQKDVKFSDQYVADYLHPNELVKLERTHVVKGENVGSPMGGNMAAFSLKDSAEVYADRIGGSIVPLNTLDQ